MPHARNLVLLIVITGALAIAQDIFPKAILADAPVDEKKIEEAEAFFDNGLDAFKAKKYDDARKSFNNAVSRNPEYAEAYAKLGDTLEALKEEELAYENYQRCIELINKMESPTPAQTALIDEVIKKTAKFRVFDEKINSLNKDLVAKLLELSDQCMTDADYVIAKEMFSLILQVEEKNEEATQGLQKAGEEIEKGKAKEEESGKAEDSQLAESFYTSGLAQMEQKDYEAAITKFRKALAYRPEYPEALFKLGEAYEKNKQPKESINPYREYQRLLTGKVTRTKEEEQSLSQVLRRLDQLDTNGKQLIKIKSNYISELFKLANQCAAKKYINFAVRILNRILEIDPANKDAQELLNKFGMPKITPEPKKSDKSKPTAADLQAAAQRYESANRKYDQGKFDEAIADYTEAIRLDPKYTNAYYSRGNAYNDKGEIDRAIADFNKAIELNPKSAEAYNNRGNAYDKKGVADKAIADFTEAIRLDPKLAFARNNRGTVYNTKGELDKAITDYTEAIRINPKYANAYYNRGISYAGKKDYKQAVADVEQSMKLAPNTPRTAQMKQFIEEWKKKLAEQEKQGGQK